MDIVANLPRHCSVPILVSLYQERGWLSSFFPKPRRGAKESDCPIRWERLLNHHKYIKGPKKMRHTIINNS